MRGCCEAVDAGIVVVEEISMPPGSCVCGVGPLRLCLRRTPAAQLPSEVPVRTECFHYIDGGGSRREIYLKIASTLK